MLTKPEITKIKVIIYQRDIKEWHAITFDISDKHCEKWIGEATCETRYEAEEYAKQMEDFYLCDLEVNHG